MTVSLKKYKYSANSVCMLPGGVPIDEKKKYFFYMFRRHTDGYTKIGITNNVCARIKKVSSNCGVSLDPILWIQMAEKEVRELESIFLSPKIYCYSRKYRTKGEWFNLPLASLLEMQNKIYLEAWSRYQAETQLLDKPTVLFYGLDQLEKRKAAIAGSFGIESEDALSVWKVLNNIFLAWLTDRQLSGLHKPSVQLKGFTDKYCDNFKVRTLLKFVELANDGLSCPDSYPPALVYLCFEAFYIAEKMLSCYASEVDVTYPQRCIEAFDAAYENTQLVDSIGLPDSEQLEPDKVEEAA